MMRYFFILSVLMVLSACNGKRGISDLSPEENAELNQYMARRDDCLVQEAARQDDGNADINAVSDLVMWKCAPAFGSISSLLYDKYNVDLSSAYAFKTQGEEQSRKQVVEAILANRKRNQGADSMQETMRKTAPAMQMPMLAPMAAQPAVVMPQGSGNVISPSNSLMMPINSPPLSSSNNSGW